MLATCTGDSKDKGMTKAKRTTLLLILLFGVLVLLIAMSLPTLELRSGQPFSLGQSQPLPFGTGNALPSGDLAILVLRGFLALALIVVPLAVLYALMTPSRRRQLLVYVVVMVLLLFAADYLHSHNTEAKPRDQPTIFGAMEDPTRGDSNTLPTSVFTPNPPPSLTFAVVLVTAATVLVLIVAAVGVFRRRQAAPTSLERLAEEVQSAIESLHTGGDLKTTIIHCYQEMSRVVQEEKGVARQEAMTTREFEQQLVSIGLPPEPVKTLTGLFERVRYGNTPADGAEETLALTCLTNIVKACRGEVVAHEA